jgi:hypothetical protein
MDQNLEIKNIPSKYKLCFNEACQLREKCMHYQAYLRKPETVLGGPAIYPDAWKNGQCERYNEVKMVRKAWGFTRIYNNVPQYLVATAAVRLAITSAEAADHITAIIMARTNSRPSSSKKS